ncbi:LysR substrate-binding domain-containing protein [Bradyrhizobium sp. USDA 4353]
MPTTLDLKLLRSFVMVADLKSVSRAAQHLHRVQSAVSQQIQKLELQVGAPLFGRAKGGFTLTPLGQTLYPIAVKLLALNDEMIEQVDRRHHKNVLIIGTSDVYAQHHVAQILGTYNDTFRHVRTELVCGYSSAIWHLLLEGTIDVAITQSRPDSVPGEILYAEPLVWVAARHYTPDQLRPLPLALYGDGCADRTAAIKSLTRANIAYDIISESNHFSGVIAPVKVGIAVSVLPLSAVDRTISVLSPSHGLPQLGTLEISISQRRRTPPKELTGFCEAARSYFASAMMNAPTEQRPTDPKPLIRPRRATHA